MPNRLAAETSPYLRQHAENPVDWYPWSEEALARARAEDRPILLSIGYAACHWCHVMAHESFEDAETARLMNDRFVNIKVDREERPDLDAIYMQAVQAMTGHGGWPMTVFLTPAGEPFYGGTYYPPQDRHGLPSFRRVLAAVSDTWQNRRPAVDETAGRLRQLSENMRAPQALGDMSAHTLELAYRALARGFDDRHGGFNGAPKFPPSMALDFLLRFAARTGTEQALNMVLGTFRAMARGGVFDQVGGGLHRYSVDDRWLVPHFEKMLYDNALFARLGVHLWQVTRDAEVRRATEATLDWALREMRSPEGGFYSSLDADSEGEEGKFYVWHFDEIAAALGGDAEIARKYWGITPSGNFEGRNILVVPNPAGATAARTDLDDSQTRTIERARAVLHEIRSRRVPPGRDEKALASWNALLVRAIAEAARVFDRDDYRSAALEGGAFIERRLMRDGRVMRSYKDGVTKGPGFLEDQSAAGLAFFDIYSLTFDPRWAERSRELADGVLRWFYEAEEGFVFDTPRDHERLIARPREVMDNATPSGSSLAAELLLRIGELTGDATYTASTESIVRQSAAVATRFPHGFGHLLGVADAVVHGAPEVVIVGDAASDEFRSLVHVVGDQYIPSMVLAGGREEVGRPFALLRGRSSQAGRATAFVCRRYECQTPVTSRSDLADQLRAVARPVS